MGPWMPIWTKCSRPWPTPADGCCSTACADNGQTLGELCRHLDMSRQAVTKHLAILEEANLVVVIWRGREKLHYLNPVPIHEIADRWIGKFERGRLRALAELKKRLEGEQDG